MSKDLLLSSEALHFIVAKSASLLERAQEPDLEIHLKRISASCDFTDQITAWKQSLTDGDDEAFDRVLTWLGVNEASLGALFDDEIGEKSEDLPAWALSLQETLSLLELCPPDSDIVGPGGEPMPFQELWHSLSIAAEEKVRNDLAKNTFATENLLGGLRYDLITVLASLGMRVMYSAFSAYRTSFYTAGAPSPLSREAYDSFVAELFAGKLAAILLEYSVLARLIGVVISQWQTNTISFLGRLAADAESLGELYDCSVFANNISVRTGLSDRHRNGQRCLKVCLNDSVAVLYKPRSLAPEEFFAECLDRFTSPELPPPLVPKVLSREEYGWEEFIPQKPCTTKREVKDYFRSAGSLVFFTYLLSGSDFHSENVIAAASSPVLIDLEGIASHLPSEMSVYNTLGVAAVGREYFSESVLRSALIATQLLDDQDCLHDIGGFPARYPGATTAERVRWKHPTTDALTPERRRVAVSSPCNEVFLGENRINPLDFVADLIDGFTAQYRFFSGSDYSAEFIRLLSSQSSLTSRFIYRDTALYSKLTERMISAESLKSGIEHGIALAGLCRAQALLSIEQTAEWAVVLSEHEQMLALDAPIFFSSLDSNSLFLPGGTEIPSFFFKSALSEIQDRVASLSEIDMERQLSLIRMSYQVRDSSAARGMTPTNGKSPSVEQTEVLTALCSRLCESAVPSGAESVNWLGVFIDHESEQRMLQPMMPRLYDGFSGPALVLGLASAVLDDSKLLESARAALKPLESLEDNLFYARAIRREGIGGFTGVCSLLYAVSVLDDLCGVFDGSIITELLLQQLQEEEIENAQKLDVLDGVSGAALVLAKLFDKNPSRVLNDLLGSCKARLLAVQADTFCYSGFAHGSSGVMAALARLGRVLDDAECRKKADELLLHERLLFSEKKGAWNALYVESEAPQFNRWCHGTPGMLLARVEVLKGGENSAATEDLELTKELIKSMEDPVLWNLCCGSAGIADIAGRLGSYFEDSDLLIVQQRLIERAVSMADALADDGQYRDPGLFHGYAGLAYSIIRYLNPGCPSILLLE